MALGDEKRKHILLTALGVGKKETTYKLNRKTYSTQLSPIALFNLLPENDRFGEVVTLCTKRAKEETFPVLSNGLPIPCTIKPIPEGHNDSELSDILRIILESIPEHTELTLDLTHGLRSFPFLFFTSSLYLSALKDVHIRGSWYGMLEAKDPDGTCPFIDLSILLEMAEWFQAAKSFRDESNPMAIVKMMKKKSAALSHDSIEKVRSKRAFDNFINSVEGFALDFGAGLPLELGRQAASMVDTHSRVTNELDLAKIPVPLAKEMMETLVSAAEPYDFPERIRFRGKWKENVPLSQQEFQRQGKLIDQYLEYGLFNNAVGLMREVIVSRVFCELTRDEPNLLWLKYKGRKVAQDRLNALVEYSRSNIPPGEDLKKLADSGSVPNLL